MWHCVCSKMFRFSTFCAAKFGRLIPTLPANTGLSKQSFEQTHKQDNFIPGVSKIEISNFQDPQISMCKCLKTYASQAAEYFWKNHDSIVIHIFKM